MSTNNGTMDPPKKRHLLKQRFQVIKKLGQGTYGKVQLAVNKESGQEVAIKTIRKSMVETEQDLVRIRREIQIMSSMQHPHIIHIYEVFENKDKIVLVMQFAPGGELYEYLSERKVFDDLEARRIFRQISSAIYYCHKNHICHRDLKLENILIDEKGNAKIGDFGLSNVFDEKHFLSTFCGSPLYASPEIVKGEPYYGPEVDCWSLGVLLYTLVYGAMPFDGSNFRRLVKQISESNYYEPQNKSEASVLIKRLLTVNPKKRATIVDVCTDNWINSGFENSLLQVSEDLSNLTPVRLDILVALAPQSPPSSIPPTQNKSLKNKIPTETCLPPPVEPSLKEDENGLKSDATGLSCPTTNASPTVTPTSSHTPLSNSATKPIVTAQLPTARVPPSVFKYNNISSPTTTATQSIEEVEEDIPVERKDSIDTRPEPESGVSSFHSSNAPTRQTSIDSSSESKGQDDGSKRNPPLERRSSSVANRRVGRLSIPNFLEIQERSPALKKPVPSYGSIEYAKKKLLERKDSIASDTKEPEHVFPTIPVAEVKQDVERRASTIDAPTLTKGPQGIRLNSITNEDEIIRGKKKVMGRRSTEPLAMFRTDIESTRSKEMTDSQQQSSEQLKQSEGKETSLAMEVDEKQVDAKVRMAGQRGQLSERGSGKEGLQIPEAVSESPELVYSPSPTKEEVDGSRSRKDRKQSLKSEAKLKLDMKAAMSESPQQPLVEPPDSSTDQGPETSQQQLSLPPSTLSGPISLIKPAPITRSYKKVTFTKNGACITETKKVYSTEGPDGKITRVEKKSKVTHYPSTASGEAGNSNNAVRESSVSSTSHEEVPTVDPNNGNDSSPSFLASFATPPNFSEPFKSSSKSSIRKSESISSSGSTDIFDDIFDSWSGDTMFNNMISPRLKTLLHPSLFNMKRGEGGQRKSKSRAESCDRRDSVSMTTGSASQLDADEDPSSTFAATSSPFSGGLFKFARENSNQTLLDRHRTMFSDPYNSNPSDSAFSNNENFFNLSTPCSSRLGRERATSSASGDQNPVGRCVAYSRSRPPSLFRDSFDSTNGPDNFYTVTTPRSSISSPFVRSNTNTSDGSSDTIKPDDTESEDSVASRKRVEQWLHISPTDQANNPYATVRRPTSRYARTLSSRLSQDLSDDMTSNPDGEDFRRLRSRGGPASVQMRSSLGSPNRSRQVYKPSSVYSDPRLNRQWEEPISVPEASTLLQQLQMHGYKNLVNQQIVFGPDKKLDDGPLAGQPYRKDFNTNNNTSPTTPTNCSNHPGFDSPTTPTNASVNKPLVTSMVTLDLGQPSPASTNGDQPTSSATQPTNGDVKPSEQPSDQSMPTTPSEETVKERIHRKSYYSRFNDEPVRRSSSVAPQMYDWPYFRQSQ